jgi:hypothetical protein
MPDPSPQQVTGLFSPQSLPKPPIITQTGGESPISVFEYYTLKTLVKYYALKTLVKYVRLKTLVK